jgi:hypothetical protein
MAVLMDLAVDLLTHDLSIENFDLELRQDIDRVRHSLKIRLWFFKAEWFLDTTYGVPFYEDILVKNPNVPNIDNIIKATILDTADVNAILAYTSNFDNATRKLTVTFTVDTTFGPLDFQEELI